jgi:aspartyl-tRNA(Asn)/glutamyl-tRNA(Gln) amidotransferase subunit A
LPVGAPSDCRYGAGNRAYKQDVAEQIAEAERVHATDHLEAQRFRGDLVERMAHLFKRVDALVLPTSRVVAPRLEESDPYLLVLLENCAPWSFIGFPAVSVSCGLTAGLTVGLELVAAPYDEGVLLALGSAVEDTLDMPVLPKAPTAS